MSKSLSRKIEASKKVRYGFLEASAIKAEPPLSIGDVVTIKDPMVGLIRYMIVPDGDERAQKNRSQSTT
jgi:hypothetical protein